MSDFLSEIQKARKALAETEWGDLKKHYLSAVKNQVDSQAKERRAKEKKRQESKKSGPAHIFNLPPSTAKPLVFGSPEQIESLEISAPSAPIPGSAGANGPCSAGGSDSPRRDVVVTAGDIVESYTGDSKRAGSTVHELVQDVLAWREKEARRIRERQARERQASLNAEIRELQERQARLRAAYRGLGTYRGVEASEQERRERKERWEKRRQQLELVQAESRILRVAAGPCVLCKANPERVCDCEKVAIVDPAKCATVTLTRPQREIQPEDVPNWDRAGKSAWIRGDGVLVTITPFSFILELPGFGAVQKLNGKRPSFTSSRGETDVIGVLRFVDENLPIKEG